MLYASGSSTWLSLSKKNGLAILLILLIIYFFFFTIQKSIPNNHLIETNTNYNPALNEAFVITATLPTRGYTWRVRNKRNNTIYLDGDFKLNDIFQKIVWEMNNQEHKIPGHHGNTAFIMLNPDSRWVNNQFTFQSIGFGPHITIINIPEGNQHQVTFEVTQSHETRDSFFKQDVFYQISRVPDNTKLETIIRHHSEILCCEDTRKHITTRNNFVEFNPTQQSSDILGTNVEPNRDINRLRSVNPSGIPKPILFFKKKGKQTLSTPGLYVGIATTTQNQVFINLSYNGNWKYKNTNVSNEYQKSGTLSEYINETINGKRRSRSTDKWKTSEWSTCSKPCSNGIKTRTVKCVDANHQEIDDHLCPAQKPATQENCNQQSCTHKIDSWSPCSAPCGGGTQTRNILCISPDGRSQNPQLCNDEFQKPENTQSCNQQPCQHKIEEWGPCNDECNGTKYREIKCTDHNGTIIDSTYCNGLPKINTYLKCNTNSNACKKTPPPAPPPAKKQKRRTGNTTCIPNYISNKPQYYQVDYISNSGGITKRDYIEYDEITGNNYKYIEMKNSNNNIVINREEAKNSCSNWEIDSKVRFDDQDKLISIAAGLTNEDKDKLSYIDETTLINPPYVLKDGQQKEWSWGGEVDMFNGGLNTILDDPHYGTTVRCKPPAGITDKKKWCQDDQNIEPEPANSVVGTFH